MHRSGNPRLRRALVAVAVTAASVVATATGTGTPAAAQGSPAPTQWIAKQFTEILGRAPSADEWADWVAYYEGNGCSATTLGQLGRYLASAAPHPTTAATLTEIDSIYPSSTANTDDGKLDRAARISGVIRAAYNHDPNSSDVSLFSTYLSSRADTDWDGAVNFAYALLGFFTSQVTATCSPSSPAYGFLERLTANDSPAPPANAMTVPVRAIAGVAPTPGRPTDAAALRAALDAADDVGGSFLVELDAGITIELDGPIDVPAGVTLRTAGSPGVAAYGRMARLALRGDDLPLQCGGTPCQRTGIVRLASGSHVASVWVDALEAGPTNTRLANVQSSGSTTGAPTTTANLRLTDPGPDGVGVRALGYGTSGTACAGAQIATTTITGYGGTDRLLADGTAVAASGLTLGCEGTTVTATTIVDLGGTGVRIEGAANRDGSTRTQTSDVSGTTILAAGLNAAVGVVADPVGTCASVRGGPPIPCLDVAAARPFGDATFAATNLITGSRTRFTAAAVAGATLTWGNHRVPATLAGGATRTVSITGTTTGVRSGGGTAGARVVTGLAVQGMPNAEVVASGTTFQPALVSEPDQRWLTCPGAAVLAGTTDGPALTLSGGLAATTTNAGLGCVTPAPAATGLDRIVRSGGTFATTGGRPFSPWGFNYAQFDNAFWSTCTPTAIDAGDPCFGRVVEDFRDMRRMGANLVRIILSVGQLYDPPPPGQTTPVLRTAVLGTIDRLVALADDTGLYLDITGLGIEFTPDANPATPAYDEDWYGTLGETARWAIQSQFWTALAGRGASADLSGGADNPNAIAWYNLMNEPVVPTAAIVSNGTSSRYCLGELGGSCWVQWITDVPAADAAAAQAKIKTWMRTIGNALKGADHDRLVTVGLMPWGISSFTPADMLDPDMTDPAQYAPFATPGLDFASVHIYPCGAVPFPGASARGCTADADHDLVPDDIEFDLDSSIGGGGTLDPAAPPVVIEELGNFTSSEAGLEAMVLGARARGVDGSVAHYWRTPDGRSTPAELDPRNDCTELMFTDLYHFFLRGPVVGDPAHFAPPACDDFGLRALGETLVVPVGSGTPAEQYNRYTLIGPYRWLGPSALLVGGSGTGMWNPDRYVSNPSATASLDVIDRHGSDAEVSMGVAFTTGTTAHDAKLILRAPVIPQAAPAVRDLVDTENFLTVRVRTDASGHATLQLYKSQRPSGSSTTTTTALAPTWTAPGPAPTTATEVRVTIVGATINVYWNRGTTPVITKTLSAADGSYYGANTGFGIGARNPGWRIDNVRVVPR